MSEGLSSAVGTTVRAYTWLMFDALLLLLLLAALLGYKDFDDPMRLLTRGAFVASLGFFWVSSLHLLVYLRCSDRRQQMPWWVSYPLHTAKLALVLGLGWWACFRGAL